MDRLAARGRPATKPGSWTGSAAPALTGRACSLTGVAVLTDALAVGRNDRGHELGVEAATATGRFTLRAGESAAFALAHSVWVGWVRPGP
jgi:hypothetical protein